MEAGPRISYQEYLILCVIEWRQALVFRTRITTCCCSRSQALVDGSWSVAPAARQPAAAEGDGDERKAPQDTAGSADASEGGGAPGGGASGHSLLADVGGSERQLQVGVLVQGEPDGTAPRMGSVRVGAPRPALHSTSLACGNPGTK